MFSGVFCVVFSHAEPLLEHQRVPIHLSIQEHHIVLAGLYPEAGGKATEHKAEELKLKCL